MNSTEAMEQSVFCVRRKADASPACVVQCQGCSFMQCVGMDAPVSESAAPCPTESERLPSDSQIGGKGHSEKDGEAWKSWRDTDPEILEPFYSKWVGLLTSEGLHSKADIATVLALLDQRIHALQSATPASLNGARLTAVARQGSMDGPVIRCTLRLDNGADVDLVALDGNSKR